MRGSAARGAAGRVTSSMVAVVSVVAITAALVAFVFDGPRDETTAASDEPATQSTPKPQKSTEKAAPKPAPKPSPKPQRKAKPKPEPTQAPEPAVPSVYVEVYNMTSVSGLASSKAAQLQDAGWQVVGIDNWRGNIPESTVYYPDGMSDAAIQLANTLGIGRTRGAVSPMKFDRLTVILASDAV